MMNDPVIVASASAALASAMGFLLGMAIAGRHDERHRDKIKRLERQMELASTDIINKSIEIAGLQEQLLAPNLSKEKKHKLLQAAHDILNTCGVKTSDAQEWMDKVELAKMAKKKMEELATKDSLARNMQAGVSPYMQSGLWPTSKSQPGTRLFGDLL